MINPTCDRCGAPHVGTGLRRLRVSIEQLTEELQPAGYVRRSFYDLCDPCLQDVTIQLDASLERSAAKEQP